MKKNKMMLVAAVATVLARVVECTIIIVYTHTHTGRHPFAKGLYRSMMVPAGLVRQVSATGMPLLINELLGRKHCCNRV